MKRNRSIIISAALVAASGLLLAAVAMAGMTGDGPRRPAVEIPLDSAKEKTIESMTGLSAEAFFERLKGMEFFLSEEYAARAVYRVFGNRKAEILARALDALESPLSVMVQGRLVSRSADLGAARRIFEVFPDEAVPAIVELYGTSDAVTKGNVLRVAGRIEGEEGIRRLLTAALGDKTFCEQENPGDVGEPLRLCDLAYNQLVLRYQIPKVLRAIGPVYRVEVRDYHIGLMKDLLQAGETR